MMKIKRVTIVLANYCPHCVPFSLQNAERMAKDFGVPLRVLNVEIVEEEKTADELVEKYGDWSEDYLIPQVFIEYEDGRIDHMFTGFSEAVSVTESSWEKLFSSRYYKNLIDKRLIRKSLEGYVKKYLNFKGQCRRHCNKSTSLIGLTESQDDYVGAYVCPDGFVSRVIYFTNNPDVTWFKNYLKSQVGENMISDRDLRPATRYGWELGNTALYDIQNINASGNLKEVYWTVYPKNEEQKRKGIFLCLDSKENQGCKILFVQDIDSENTLCSKCR
jgi:hypothetical protein